MTQSTKRVNQVDIARAAGVSTATVSRALNGTGVVTPDARARIDAAIAELGYMPHGAARALASRRSHTVGAVIPTLASAIFAAGIDAFERRLNEAGLTLLLSLSNYDLASEALKVRRLLERGVDAIMLVGSMHAPEVHEAIARTGVPYIHTWAWEDHGPHPYVGFDNFEAAQAVGHHLADLGHKRIAMIAGITADNDRAAQRVAGAVQGLRDRGIEFAPEPILETAYRHAEARKALGEVLAKSSHTPTAIICGNDVLATGALLEAQARGIDVPQELSITGFDDLPLMAHLNPPLTTIAVPAEEMGSGAAESLITALERSEMAKGRRLPAELLARRTSGPAPVAVV